MWPPWLRLSVPLFAASMPGCLAGTQMAGLLFFLNPHLPFQPVPVLRGVVFFGGLLGIASSALVLPFTWRRPGRALRWIPWTLTAVLASSALAAWIHASYYAFFLPSGINRRLLKAALLLTVAAVVCFYTAFLHRLRNRRYGARSWILFTVLALVSIYVMMERREAFKPRVGPDPRATTFRGQPRPQILVLGLEAATFDAVLPLAEQGRLPFFNRILDEGFSAHLSALRPTYRSPSWTTLATGRLPFRHGIVNETVVEARFLGGQTDLSLLPIGIGFNHWGTWRSSRPIEAGMRRVLTLWEILARLDLSTIQIGWPLSTFPSSASIPEGMEAHLSERFFQQSFESDADAWPQEVLERARLFRPQSGDLDPDQTSRFGELPSQIVLDALAGDVWREELSFFLLDHEPQVDALFLVLPGLGQISAHYFGGYSAVQFEGATDSASEEATQIVAAYYEHLDEFLRRLWDRSREPRLLVVVSAHGVEEEYGWRKILRILRRQPSLEGVVERGPDGVLMLLGEGIQSGTRLASAEPVDVVPTLLYGLGLPIARDLDGAVLTSAFENPFLARQPITFLPSYETFTAERPSP